MNTLKSLQGKNVVVVGGGWSGIASAWYLHNNGANVTIIDDQPALGGRSTSELFGKKYVTFGGKNIGRNYIRFHEFAKEIGENSWEFFGINSSQVREGKVRKLNSNHRLSGTFQLFIHSKFSDVLRLIWYGINIRLNPNNRYLDGPIFRPRGRAKDQKLSEVFGSFVTQNLVRPMTVRMNGAEPDETFLSNFGTNLSLVLDQFDQISDGFESIFSSIQLKVPTISSSRVTSLNVINSTIDSVEYIDSSGKTNKIKTQNVVLAMTAPQASLLLHRILPIAAKELSVVPYHPVSVLICEYDRDIFSENTRAIVFDPKSKLSNAGAYGANERYLIRYTFSGKSARDFLLSNPTTQQLIDAAEEEFEKFRPVKNAKLQKSTSKTWLNGLCSYGENSARRLQAIQLEINSIQGLAVAGDYVAGASIEACFKSAEQAVSTLNSIQVSD